MPNKYSHGLVFYHQQHQGVIHTDPPLSLKPPSSRNPRSHTRSTAASTRSSSNHSTQSNVHSRYLRLEPDPEPEPSYSRRSSAYTSRFSFDSTPSDAAPLESASTQRSRPPSDRLRLESPFGFRIENPPSAAPKLEPEISDRSQCEPIPSHRPDAESCPPGRLRLESPLRLYSQSPRPSLHHKSSSVETQIYAPEPTSSSSSTREGQNILSVETHEPYPSYQNPTSSTYTQEPQHVFLMDSPGSSPPPISTGNRRERSSSEIQGVYLPSPTRDRRQRFVRETQTLASPPCVQDRQAHSPFGTQETPLFPSTRELQDYFSLATQDSQSAPSATGDRQNVSSLKAHSASLNPSQEAYVRPSCDMQQLQSSHQTQGHQRRRFLGTRDSSSERRPHIGQESANARRESFDSQTTQDRQIPPASGPWRLSSDLSIQRTQRSRRASIDSKPAQEHRPQPRSSSQQLSLKQFIQESEHMWEPSNTSQIYSPESSSSHRAEPNSRQTMSTNAQGYTPKSPRLEHSPRSRRDRPSKLPNTFASQHRILLPTSEGDYDNVMVETHGFPPERPPSPPATPDSGKGFSRLPQTEASQKTRPPPIPQRSTRRSPPRQQSILSSTNSSVVNLPSEIPRPKTSSAIDPPTNSRKATALHSPTFSISTRRSSINATMSPQSVSFSDFSETMKSPRRVSFSQSRDREYFEDTDLESLPPDIDFNVLPYENPNAGPAIFRATQLGLENPVSPRYEEPNIEPVLSPATQPGLEKSISHGRPVSSRSSSFDSAAPPPISLNGRISYASAESYEFKTPKKESRMSLISFLRSTTAPKAVLYSEATQGKPPVPVSVSRTAVPSIPLLFPGYRGQFPPPQKTQDKGLKAGLEPGMKPGSDARPSGARSTAHMDAAEKRKSWFKGDDVDKNREASRPAPANKWELERILSHI